MLIDAVGKGGYLSLPHASKDPFSKRAEPCNVEIASPELRGKSNTLKPNQQEKRVTFYQCLHKI